MSKKIREHTQEEKDFLARYFQRQEVSREIKGPFEIVHYDNGTIDVRAIETPRSRKNQMDMERKEAERKEAELHQAQADECRDRIRKLCAAGKVDWGKPIVDVAGVEFKTAITMGDLMTNSYPLELHLITVVIQVLEARYGGLL